MEGDHVSMSSCVVLLRDRNDTSYLQKLAVLHACEAAGIEPPDEIYDYFGEALNPESPLEIEYKPRVWKAGMREGFEVDLDTLPEGVKTIRFYNSW